MNKKLIVSILTIPAVLVVSVIWLIVGVRIYQMYQVYLASERDPLMQPFTNWKSEDEQIVFSVDDDHHAVGTMNIDGQIIDFCFIPIGPYYEELISFLDVSVLEDGVIEDTDRYELCSVSYLSEKEFVITVEEGTYLKEGQEITFYRVDENGTPSE